MPFCENNAILAKYEPGIKINPLRCNCWSCSSCQPIRAGRLRSEAYRGSPNTFITLTVNPAVGGTVDERACGLVNAWRKIRRKAQKAWNNVKIPYLVVMETTEQGEPHLHILCRSKWIDQKWLSQEMEAEIGAPIVDIRRIQSQKSAAKYVAKYVGKDPQRFKGTKRYWKTRDYLVIARKVRPDPIGERSDSWFERGSVTEIIEKYCKKYYRHERYRVGSVYEYWLVDDWKGLGQRAQNSSDTLQMFGSSSPGASSWGISW